MAMRSGIRSNMGLMYEMHAAARSRVRIIHRPGLDRLDDCGHECYLCFGIDTWKPQIKVDTRNTLNAVRTYSQAARQTFTTSATVASCSKSRIAAKGSCIAGRLFRICGITTFRMNLILC